MKIVLTGANGVVGRALTPLLKKTFADIVGLDLKNCAKDDLCLDLTDFKTTNTSLKSLEPDVILHFAGTKDLSLCEKDKELSHLLNFKVTENLASLSKEIGSRLIFMSSDYVFDGKGGPFTETSICKPKTQYGKDKLESENYIKATLQDYTIVRSSAIFGHKNDFVDIVLRNIKESKPFKAFGNLISNPTYVEDLSEMLKIILSKNINGTYHCSGSQSLSRFDFACAIADCFQFEKSVIVKDTLDFSKDVRAKALNLNNTFTYKTLNYYPELIDKILIKNKNKWVYSP